MTPSIYQEVRELAVIAYLYAASTEKMMDRMMRQDPGIQSLISRLRSDTEEAARLLNQSLSVLQKKTSGPMRHPDEMVLVAVLHILEAVAKGMAAVLKDAVLQQPRHLWAWSHRYAEWKLSSDVPAQPFPVQSQVRLTGSLSSQTGTLSIDTFTKWHFLGPKDMQ